MALLNYTTKIEVNKTIAEIQTCLVRHGATGLFSEFEEGSITALSFKIKVESREISFRLPCDWQPVLQILKKDPKVPGRFCNKEQAQRVAWRIIKDWVE